MVEKQKCSSWWCLVKYVVASFLWSKHIQFLSYTILLWWSWSTFFKWKWTRSKHAHTHFAKHSLKERRRHFVVVPIWSWWVCNMHSSSIIYYNVLVLIIIITHTQNVVLLCPKETHSRYPIHYTISICHYFAPITCFYIQETVNFVEALGLHCS